MKGIILAAILSKLCFPLTELPDNNPGKGITTVSQRYTLYESKERGEARLRLAAQSKLTEEMWAFFADEERWVDIGISPTYNSVIPDTSFLFDALRKTEVVVYHTHPPEFRRGAFVGVRNNIYPSANDISNLIISSVIQSRVRDGDFRERIVSYGGITEYSLSKIGQYCFAHHWKKSHAYGKQAQRYLLAHEPTDQYLDVQFTPWESK